MAIKTFTTGEVLTAADTNTYLANAGLVLVKSQTIGNAVPNVTVPNAFSATYDNYLVIFSTVFSNGDSRIYMRGTSSTGTTYAGSFIYMNFGSATVNGAQAGSVSFFDVGLSSSVGRVDCTINIYNIFDSAIPTRMNATYSGHTYGGNSWGRDSAANSSTDLYFVPAAGTMTGGTITIYGVRKA